MHALATWVVGTLLVTAFALSGANAATRARQAHALDWKTFLVPEFGTTVEYPAGIFSVPHGKAEKGFGQRFNSADGRSMLTIYTQENEAGDTPASYLRNNLRIRRSALHYERVTRSFFAISSAREGLVAYSRCNFSSEAGGAIHCFDLVYPLTDRHPWDAIVTRISRSLRPLES